MQAKVTFHKDDIAGDVQFSNLIAADTVLNCAKSVSLLAEVTDSCIANKSAICDVVAPVTSCALARLNTNLLDAWSIPPNVCLMASKEVCASSAPKPRA